MAMPAWSASSGSVTFSRATIASTTPLTDRIRPAAGDAQQQLLARQTAGFGQVRAGHLEQLDFGVALAIRSCGGPPTGWARCCGEADRPRGSPATHSAAARHRSKGSVRPRSARPPRSRSRPRRSRPPKAPAAPFPARGLPAAAPKVPSARSRLRECVRIRKSSPTSSTNRSPATSPAASLGGGRLYSPRPLAGEGPGVSVRCRPLAPDH